MHQLPWTRLPPHDLQKSIDFLFQINFSQELAATGLRSPSKFEKRSTCFWPVTSFVAFRAAKLSRKLSYFKSNPTSEVWEAMGVLGCKNYCAVLVAMVSLVLISMDNFAEVEASAGAGSIEGDMEVVIFSPLKSMAVGLGEHLAMTNDERYEEFLEELTRRMLASATSSSIGYNALTANRTPCTSTGKSYYNTNCNKSGSQGGPYSRSCTAATRCARG